MSEPSITPDADGGATCPCGKGFSFKVWLLDHWECHSCGRIFTVSRARNSQDEAASATALSPRKGEAIQ